MVLLLPHPWCMGFLSAMQLRLKAWQPLLDLSSPDHALMLPILLHCVDALGGPMLEPPREGPETHEYIRTAYHDIPIVIPAIREFWMPQRLKQPTHPADPWSARTGYTPSMPSCMTRRIAPQQAVSAFLVRSRERPSSSRRLRLARRAGARSLGEGGRRPPVPGPAPRRAAVLAKSITARRLRSGWASSLPDHGSFRNRGDDGRDVVVGGA